MAILTFRPQWVGPNLVWKQLAPCNLSEHEKNTLSYLFARAEKREVSEVVVDTDRLDEMCERYIFDWEELPPRQ